MCSPRHYAVDDKGVLHEVIRQRVFATLAASRNSDGVAFAYAPVMLDSDNGPHGGIRFHLARQNPLAELAEGERLFLSMMACDAYVSPDWYETVVTVPTWNYVAVEGQGLVRRLSREELRTLLTDVSAQEEHNLLPKQPWTMNKMPPPRLEALLNGIVGFSLSFECLAGKFKLSQDKAAGDIAGVIGGLELRADPASLAVASAMRRLR